MKHEIAGLNSEDIKPDFAKSGYKEKLYTEQENAEYIGKVRDIVSGLYARINDALDVSPETDENINLTYYELKDSEGNVLNYIMNSLSLECPMEVRDKNGKLLAQSWDGKKWAATKYIESGYDFVL